MGCPHTSFRKGQRILLAMKDGTKEVDKYVERKSGAIVTERLGRVKVGDIRATVILR